MSTEIDTAIEHYLRTGSADTFDPVWPSRGVMECAQTAHNLLSEALVRAVRDRTVDRVAPALPAHDATDLTRRKVEPMVRGLFPRVEQDAVLRLVENSVTFLTADNIESVLLSSDRLSTAWNIANLYLGSMGAELLGDDADRLVGLSEGTACYVSLSYFDGEHPFADYLVHEVAHIFHNCKRATAGLPQTRRREWLLDIDYARRETLAYSCEAYARILQRAKSSSDRVALAETYATRCSISDERVDADEVVDIVREAVLRRNGWKSILGRCAPPRRTRAALGSGPRPV